MISRAEDQQCYYAPLSVTDPSPKGSVDIRTGSRIRKIVLSPNDETTAFILEDYRQGETILKMELYHTEDILKFLPTPR